MQMQDGISFPVKLALLISAQQSGLLLEQPCSHKLCGTNRSKAAQPVTEAIQQQIKAPLSSLEDYAERAQAAISGTAVFLLSAAPKAHVT